MLIYLNVLQRKKNEFDTFIRYFSSRTLPSLLRSDESRITRLKSMMSMSRDGLHCQVARSAAATRLGLSLIFFCRVSNDVFNVKPAGVQESALSRRVDKKDRRQETGSCRASLLKRAREYTRGGKKNVQRYTSAKRARRERARLPLLLNFIKRARSRLEMKKRNVRSLHTREGANAARHKTLLRCGSECSHWR